MPFDGRQYQKAPVSPEIADKLAKMDRVIVLLDRPEKWCKQQLRSYDGRRCILGAMMAADATAELKQPIQAAISQMAHSGFSYREPRIEWFNDHPATTHADVVKVLHRAREIIAEGRG